MAMRATGRGDEPDVEGLEAFVREGDRNRARFFVGRATPIRDISMACLDAIRRYRAGEGLAGATRLIQGAPGAGKTALLQHLNGVFGAPKEPDGLWRRLIRSEPDSPRALLVERTTLADPQDVAIQIAECLDPAKAQRFRQTRSGTAGLQAGLPGTGALSGGRTITDVPPSPSFLELRKQFPPGIWKRPICLMVDEIQNLERGEAGTLEALHLGTADLPIVPVLAGLGNARDVLAQCGISRLSDDCVHSLGCLEPGQSTEAVRQMLDTYRVDAKEADAERWSSRLETDSDGWPQHLQNAMRSLAEALVETNGVLAAVDEHDVLERARDRRIQGYRARRSTQMETALFLIARVMANIPDTGLRRHELNDAIRAFSRQGGSSALRLPDGFSTEEFLDHLIHRGALQGDRDGRLRCPIPSFRHFLMQDGASVLADTVINSGQPGDFCDEDLAAFADEVLPELDAEDQDQPSS